MATFSQDQVRQFYVVESIKNSTKLTNTDPAGTITALADGSAGKHLWFEYMTPNGNLTPGGSMNTIVRSDLVERDNITEIRFTSVPKTRPFNRQQVVLDPSINMGMPVVGQEYILRFTIYGLGIGGQEVQYIKNGGAYRVKPGDNTSSVLENLAVLAKLNFSREPFPYIHVTTDTFDPWTTNTMPGTSTRLVVEEVPQPWVRGKRQADAIKFQTQCVRINYNGIDMPWGIVSDTTVGNTNVLGNGQQVCDMEYFYIGERADQFRGMKWPDNFETTYMAKPENRYVFMDLTYFYAGDKEDAGTRSKKTITWAVNCPYNTGTGIYDVPTDFIGPFGVDAMLRNLLPGSNKIITV